MNYTVNYDVVGERHLAWWNGWPLQRAVVLFVGIAFCLIFFQVTLFHYRQNFRQWTMWGPVLGTPVIGITAALMALLNARVLSVPLIVLLALGILEGLVGTFMHVRGVGQRVEGYVLRNFMVGPPLILPMMVSAMGVLGLLGLAWR